METCQIVIESVPDPLRLGTFHHVPSRIEGDLRNPVIVAGTCRRLLSLEGKGFPEKVGMMGLDFRLLGYDFLRDEAAYICVTPWPFRWMFHKSVLTARYAYSWFKMRAILTLHVWGLADVPPYDIPSWSHIGKRAPRLK